jgi:hypothetical protein
MNTKTLISTKSDEFYYAHRMVKPGESFEADEKDAHILEMARVARAATPEEVERESTPEAPQEKPRKKRTYSTRHMTAEKPQ